jgi:1-deoxy-D-xylulose-5-phosphate reductoisomerase
VHGLVEFRDGSVVAQLGAPDMRIPIAHCLAWPDRINGPAPRLDLAKVASLTFEEPDTTRFPALTLARHAMETGGIAPTIFNAANEIAVAAFLKGQLSFLGIAALVEATLARVEGLGRHLESVADALAVNHNGRLTAADLLPQIAAKAH